MLISGELTYWVLAYVCVLQRFDRVRIVDTDTNRLGWWLGECNGKVRSKQEGVRLNCVHVELALSGTEVAMESAQQSS